MVAPDVEIEDGKGKLTKSRIFALILFSGNYSVIIIRDQSLHKNKYQNIKLQKTKQVWLAFK